MRLVRTLSGYSVALACAGAFTFTQVLAQPDNTTAPQGSTSSKVDNTGLNSRDKNQASLTPQNQTNAATDRKLLAAVRRTVTREKSFSTAAHNIKMMVAGGAVTLRGPVKSDGEKAKIEELVKQVNGVESVDNQLDVKTN